MSIVHHKQSRGSKHPQGASRSDMAALTRCSEASAAAFVPVERVNIDGLEGSSIPGGLHLARYGGGDDYRQVDPLLP